jgi:cell division protein FtsL
MPSLFSRRPPVGTLLAFAAAVYLGMSLVQIVQRNYELKKQLTSLEQQVEALEAEKQELSYRIEYYRTEAYAEKAARAKLGLQAPGEGVIILPKVPPPPPPPPPPKPTPSSNWRQWMQFLFG